MLITYRGRQYDSTRKPQARDLAALLLIPVCIDRLHSEAAPQSEVDAALWEAIGRHLPGSLTHTTVGGSR